MCTTLIRTWIICICILNIWFMIAPNAYAITHPSALQRQRQKQMRSIANSTSTQDLDNCLTKTGATLIYRNNNSTSRVYANLTTPGIVGFNYHPPVLVLPNSTQQVSKIVKCVGAHKGKKTLTVVGGGHNYASFSFTGDVVILSHNMTNIEIDDTKKQASVQFGQKLGPMARALATKGYGLPHGMCPSVGVAGHSLGGGWGFTGRHWGWLVDHSMY